MILNLYCRCGKENATHEEMIEATKTAYVLDFIIKSDSVMHKK